MSEKKKRTSKQRKEKKLSKRQVAANDKAIALAELAEQAKSLCIQIEKGDKSARELGELLLKVKTYGPPRGLKNWIQTNLGTDEVTRNRCNYAISLANPNSARNRKKQIHTSAVVFHAVREIRQVLPKMEKAVANGFTGEVERLRAIVITDLDKLVKRANYMANRIGRELYLRKQAQSDDPRLRAFAEKVLSQEFNDRTLMKEDGRFVLPEENSEHNAAKPEQAQAATATS
jgi:hypothetical protein